MLQINVLMLNHMVRWVTWGVKFLKLSYFVLFCFIYKCTWEEELVVKSWKFYRIDLWKKIERLIFKSFYILCDYVKSLVGKMIMA